MMDDYTLVNVSSSPELWSEGDPVRPELNVNFKTAPGRMVFGLRSPSGDFAAFCCVARTEGVPKDIMELSQMTSEVGDIFIPYTVWSMQRGAGKTIIKRLLDNATVRHSASRVVTLSPLTDMARRFHLKNGAEEFAVNISSANFEYPVYKKSDADDWYQSAADDDWTCSSQGEQV